MHKLDISQTICEDKQKLFVCINWSKYQPVATRGIFVETILMSENSPNLKLLFKTTFFLIT